MKKIILKKVFKDTIFVMLFAFIGWFFLTWICGVSEPIQPGSAGCTCKSISIKEVLNELPSIILIAILGGIFYFPIGYGYHKDKDKNNKKTELDGHVP